MLSLWLDNAQPRRCPITGLRTADCQPMAAAEFLRTFLTGVDADARRERRDSSLGQLIAKH